MSATAEDVSAGKTREITLNDGKYTVIWDETLHNGNGGFRQPLRYGGHWPAFDGQIGLGCNLTTALALRVMALEDENRELRDALQTVRQ
jgi:hypothetical protein